MKKFLPFILTLALLLAGCSGNAAPTTEPSTSESTQPSTDAATQPQIQQADMSAVALPAVVDTIRAEDGAELFTSTTQSIELVVPDPDVADKIIIDFLTRQDQYSTAAQSIGAAAVEAYTAENWTPYVYSALYDAMRIDENVLSLAGTVISWSGGSHPNYNCVYANYDMVTGDVMTLGSILTHKDRSADLCQLLIDAIAPIREESGIWSDYDSFIRDRFAADISYDDAWYFDSQGLCFRFTPYEIAPYASGIISVTIPYDKLVGIIEDAYFPVEKDMILGSVEAAALSDSNTGDFTQIAELVLDESGSMVLLYTQSAVYDVRIKADDSYVALATSALTPGDAIMVQADFESTTLVLEYGSGESLTERYIQVSGDTVTLLEEIPE